MLLLMPGGPSSEPAAVNYGWIMNDLPVRSGGPRSPEAVWRFDPGTSSLPACQSMKSSCMVSCPADFPISNGISPAENNPSSC